LFGYEFDELIGSSVKLIIPAPYKEQHDTYLSNYDATKIPKIIGKSRIVEGQHKDGSIFPIRLSVSKIGDGDDTIFIGMIDKMEDKSASITIDTAGTIVSCNQNVEELFGYKANELIGQNVSTLVPSPHKEKHNSYIQNYLQGGSAKVIGKVRNVGARHKSGSVFPISLQVEQLKVGSITLFRGKIEKVDLMEAVFTIDEEGKIVSCNQNFVRALFGYSNTELLGKSITTLIPNLHQNTGTTDVFGSGSEPDRKRQKLDNNNAEYSWKTAGIHKKEVLHKDGSTFPVVLEIYPFTEEKKDGEPPQYSVRIKRADFDLDKDHSSEQHKMIGNYYVVKTVGQGSYGKVKLACHKDTKENVAIKILLKTKMKPQELDRARRETEILKQLKHPNIARLIDVIETD